MNDASDDRKNLELAIYAAVRAGARILEVYNQPDIQTEYKADNSPLTEADKASHKILTEILSGSKLPILSEEGEHLTYKDRASWEQFWMIDPLDGTKEFLKKNGEFTVNVALIFKKYPAIGVVYIPASGVLYFASNTVGSYKLQLAHFDKNDLPDLSQMINLAVKLPFAKTRKFIVVASRSHRNTETELFISQLEKEHRNLIVVAVGSSLKICIVAEGNADIYPRFGPTMEWDTAAGQCVAINAGCKFTRKDTGETMFYNKTDLMNPWFIVVRLKE